MYRAVAAATAGKGETRLTDETRDADDVGADVEITPEMIEAGSDIIYSCAVPDPEWDGQALAEKVFRAMWEKSAARFETYKALSNS